jgi:hypothetical protein
MLKVLVLNFYIKALLMILKRLMDSEIWKVVSSVHKMVKLVILLIFTIPCITAFGQKNPCLDCPPVTMNRNSGYVNINELNYGMGFSGFVSFNDRPYFGLTTIHGYQLNISNLTINRSIIIAGGTGILFYNEVPMIPLFLDFRYTWNKKKLSPFLYEDSGLLLNYNDIQTGAKIFINPGAGLKFKISRSLSAIFSSGLFIQMGSLAHRESFLSLKAGVVYKPRGD